MLNHNFDLPGQCDNDETLFDGPIMLNFKINEITDYFRNVQDKNTKLTS